jgi:threonine/homoserine/homoserine lactone efflux protein
MAFGLGCAAGCLSHTLLAALGVSALIAASPVGFTALKIVGGLYLVYMGWQAIRSRAAAHAGRVEGRRETPLRLFWRGVFANAINPKVVLFFLAFLPQFVDVSAGHVGWQMALLGVVFMLVTIVVFGAVAIFAGTIGAWMRRKPAIGERLNLFAGLTFIALGIRVAMPDLSR